MSKVDKRATPSMVPPTQAACPVNSMTTRSLQELVQEVLRTGQPVTLPPDAQALFHDAHAQVIGPQIETLRYEQRAAWGKARHLMVD